MLDDLFMPYATYSTLDTALEIVAVFFGLFSVWMAKKDNILVFPTGIISTFIYVYLLWKWILWGDMMINAYYVVMSAYGWYIWTRKKGGKAAHPISTATRAEMKSAVLIFLATIGFVSCVYLYFDKFINWFAYIDTFLTGVFFVGMWLMAKKKIENWICWIIGDFISIPLYFAKGVSITSFQFLVFTIVAVFGYIEWKEILAHNKKIAT